MKVCGELVVIYVTLSVCFEAIWRIEVYFGRWKHHKGDIGGF